MTDSLPLAPPSAPPPSARQALVGAPGVRSVILEGDGVHLFVDRANRLAELRARLESAGVPCISFESTEPTIEDLFVSEVADKPIEPPPVPGAAASPAKPS